MLNHSLRLRFRICFYFSLMALKLDSLSPLDMLYHVCPGGGKMNGRTIGEPHYGLLVFGVSTYGFLRGNQEANPPFWGVTQNKTHPKSGNQFLWLFGNLS